MPTWTKEQQMAIDEDGKNIIVSAGAGSGKTAVLSERVIRKLEQGVEIDQLLILTFTKAAAFEMMIRIRDKIKARPHLKRQLSKIDSAYITTFDAFSLALVKKYHYLLGVKRDIKVLDQNIMKLEKIRMIEEIFSEYYECQDPLFFSLLEKYTLKDDQEIKDLLLSISDKLDLKYDKISYLKNYVDSFFQKEKMEEQVGAFEKFLVQKIAYIRESLDCLSSFVEGEYFSCLEDSLQPLLESTSYDAIVKNSQVKLKNLPKGSPEEAKKYKEQISSLLKELQGTLLYRDRQEIFQLLEETKESIMVIVSLLLKLDEKIVAYKQSKDAYEFNDIAKMAIRLVQENPEVRGELKNQFNEILVDEYQDTSDLQEEFIQSIANQNVYMVGDIKQSIYRFRNANPYIFKNKYDCYGKNIGGVKIDLMKNFRSRKEVLANINFIFDLIMDEEFGGCKYRQEHQMIFGNQMYEEEKKQEQNANFEVYNYTVDKDLGFRKEEIEAFLILKDIKEKMATHYQVIDKKTSTLRDCRYEDFTILMDRATQFELYKKIFEYENIPLTVYKDTSITKEDDVAIFSNLLKLIYLAFHQQFDDEFRYAFLSVSRSYLSDEQDAVIFSILEKKQYFESDVWQKIKPILKDYPLLNGVELLDRVIDAFDIYQRQILVGNMEHLMARISYLKQVFTEMGELGYSLDDIILNFNQMVKEEYDIKVSLSGDTENAVKIMTIHKSKGLEFPILYMSGLSNSFNIRDLNEKFIYDNAFGFIIPFYKNQEVTNIMKFLMKDRYIREEISEKIRLFYVALTRAREKMILITCNEKEEEELEEVVSLEVRKKYRSFLDILKSIWGNLNLYRREVDIHSLGMSKDYNLIKSSNYQSSLKKTKTKFRYISLQIENDILEQSHFSKTSMQLLTPENYKAIELGKRFHTILENLDFAHPDLSLLSDFERKHVMAFLKLPIFKHLEDAIIYKEYEFMDRQNNQEMHGIIDLLLEFPEKIILLDYKLKQTNDSAYEKQLKGYRDYIHSKSDKPIEIYLYSILEEKLRQL